MSYIRLPRPPYLISGVFAFGVFLTLMNFYELRVMQNQQYDRMADIREAAGEKHGQLVAWINGPHATSGYLDRVIGMFRKLGYEILVGDQRDNTSWDILWHHEYPFSKETMKGHLSQLKPQQKVNHVPGSGYYTSKVNLATANITGGIPIAFELPKRRDEFLQFAKANPHFLWVQKSNSHRKIRIHNYTDLNLNQAKSFVQQYIANPLLIDGRKFDIGIYTVITSIDPLRVYIYEGDTLLRFCPKSYHPFDPDDVDKYVVGDDYTPTWEMPSLAAFYNGSNLTFRETLNTYVRQKLGKDPHKIYDQIRLTIREVFQSQQRNMLSSLIHRPASLGYFELSRFDFVIDEDLNVFLMEANMSPNLSSAHFVNNKLLYDQVLLNVLSLVGATTVFKPSTNPEENEEIRQITASNRDLAIFAEECDDDCAGKQGCKKALICKLCSHCLMPHLRSILRSAYEEYVNRRNMRRILPAAFENEPLASSRFNLTEYDHLLKLWFDSKCRQDIAWCL